MKTFLDLDSGKDIKEIIEFNIAKAHQLRKEMSLLNLGTTVYVKEKHENNNIRVIEEAFEEEEEYRFYYENIIEDLKKCCTKEEKKNAICNNLPVLENKDYFNLIRRIILEFMKERYEYEKIKVGESEATILDLEKEQQEIDEIIEIIKSHATTTKEESKKVEHKSNNLIFLKTASGSVYAENDLISIDSEYYQAFKNLIETIENGTFKGVKRLRNHNVIKGMSEVKDFQIRIIFDRISINTYIIIDAFVKKTDVDLGYIEHLSRRIDYYKKNKESIIAMLDDKCIEENKKIYENLKSGLSSKNIVKTKR